MFAIPVPVKERVWLRAVELRPGNRRIVHHVNYQIDASGEMLKRMKAENDLGFQAVDQMQQFSGGGGGGAMKRLPMLIGGFLPGTTPSSLPDDYAFPIDPGTSFVIRMHYHPTGKEET